MHFRLTGIEAVDRVLASKTSRTLTATFPKYPEVHRVREGRFSCHSLLYSGVDVWFFPYPENLRDTTEPGVTHHNAYRLLSWESDSDVATEGKPTVNRHNDQGFNKEIAHHLIDTGNSWLKKYYLLFAYQITVVLIILVAVVFRLIGYFIPSRQSDSSPTGGLT
jgi:hypothetical protein